MIIRKEALVGSNHDSASNGSGASFPVKYLFKKSAATSFVISGSGHT